MKIFKALFTAALLSYSLGMAADLDSVLSDLSGSDYDARQEARNELYSMAAKATASDSASAFRTELSTTLLDAIQSSSLDQQAKVFLTRILTRMGTADSAQALFLISLDSKQSTIVQEHAVMALSALPGNAVTEMLLKGLSESDVDEHVLWWQAIQTQLDASHAEDLIKVIKQANLNNDPTGWSALGRIGGSLAADHLFSLRGNVDAGQRVDLDTAILDAQGCTVRQLKDLFESTNDPEIKTGAFVQLLQKDAKAALSELKTALSGKPSALRQRMIRLSLETGDDNFWTTVAEGISELAPAEIDTFLGCVKEQQRSEYESLAIKYLQVGVPTTQMEALRALAAVGTERSTPALLQRMDSADDDISELAIYALSQVKDPALDEQIIRAVSNPDSENRVEMLRLVAVRNNDGATALLNSILIKGADDPDLDEVLKSIEEIGDVYSCRIMLSRIIQNLSRSDLRNYQLSLKRLTIRLALDELLWESAFQPALSLAYNVEARAAIIEILDCLSSAQALDYCTSSLKKNQPEAVQQAAKSALKRWTDINASDHWVDILTDGGVSAADKREATSAILRLIKTSSIDGSSRDKAQLAYDIIMEVDDADVTDQLLAAVHDDSGLKNQFQRILEPYQDILSKWEELD